MSLSYRGPSGAIEYRWIAYALLRDNVLHHLEGGKATGDFPLLHRITEALGGDPIELDALALRREAERVRDQLLRRPIAELAVSSRTRALLSYSVPLPGEALVTQLASECDFAPKSLLLPNASTFDDAFGYLVRGLLVITEGAREGQVVQVVDL